MRIACWTPNGMNTLTEYVIRIGFPRQQWLHEYATVTLYVDDNWQ
jgi:hypothetical protein